MDLGNVFKYDIDTLKSFNDEVNEENVESPTYCTSPYRPNLIEWENGNNQDMIEQVGLISVPKSPITSTSNQPTYCTSPYKPNLIQWENGNSQDTIGEVELVTSPKSTITTTSNHLTTIPQPLITTEKKSDLSNKELLVESVLFECFEDDTSTTSDNLPVFTIDAAYCNFDSSNILHRRLRWGKIKKKD